MKKTIYSRREFIKQTAITGMGIALVRPVLGNQSFSKNNINFITPIDGDMLHKLDGIVSDEHLIVPVRISASSSSKISVNGIKAKYVDGVFVADVPLKGYKNIIEAIDSTNNQQQAIEVYRLTNFVNKYRLSLDDNIWFLRDITQNASVYSSIFDNPYLGFLKEVHDSYGTKIHLNIYYETDGFNLSQMTDKFKNEWKENSDWLQLSFHAFADKPDRPYINAGYDEVKHDCDLVMDQVRRFAGKEITGPVTTLHWGEATVEGCRALRDSGFTCLPCDFNVDNNLAPCSCYLDVEKRRHINKRLIWRDNKEGIIFVKCAIIVDTHKLQDIVPFLDEIK
ncbi:MAG: hypothetical protein PHN55_05370, partial [Dysgonamonadaceae bacterium]|nr:hypothetical protein [Dysgonamonadaceae bacterium]